jgi:hypothetical protein
MSCRTYAAGPHPDQLDAIIAVRGKSPLKYLRNRLSENEGCLSLLPHSGGNHLSGEMSQMFEDNT